VLVGFETSDDAAVYRLGDTALVATVDVFTPIVDDPFAFGQIAAANALSDVYAMGARPLFALSIVCFPVKTLPLEVLGEILRGGAAKAAEAGIAIVGGHSIDDPEPKFGLSVVGVVDPAKVVRNSTARPGDALYLTKAIGTGVLSQGVKLERTAPADAAAAIASMAALNRDAAAAMAEVAPSAATDVTGYGLLGHLHEVVHASGVTARVSAKAVPLLSGALALAAAGVIPGGSRRNAEQFARWVTFADGVDAATRTLLTDAQTSGGLLISLPAKRGPVLAEALARRGVLAARIGEIEAGEAGKIFVD
jgi:selenide,water dikinase